MCQSQPLQGEGKVIFENKDIAQNSLCSYNYLALVVVLDAPELYLSASVPQGCFL